MMSRLKPAPSVAGSIPHNPFYTGTFWENIGPDGTATESRTSLSHGWASGATPIMTSYVLGVQPMDPG